MEGRNEYYILRIGPALARDDEKYMAKLQYGDITRTIGSLIEEKVINESGDGVTKEGQKRALRQVQKMFEEGKPIIRLDEGNKKQDGVGNRRIKLEDRAKSYFVSESVSGHDVNFLNLTVSSNQAGGYLARLKVAASNIAYTFGRYF